MNRRQQQQQQQRLLCKSMGERDSFSSFFSLIFLLFLRRVLGTPNNNNACVFVCLCRVCSFVFFLRHKKKTPMKKQFTHEPSKRECLSFLLFLLVFCSCLVLDFFLSHSLILSLMRSSILLSSFSFSFSSAADTTSRRRRERGGRTRSFCRRRSFSFSSRSSGDDDENENENDDVKKKKKKKTKNATKSQKEEEKGIWKSERKRREMLLTTTLTIQTRAAFALEDFAKREEKKGVSCVDVKEGGKGQLEENDVVSVNYTLYLSDEDGTMGSKIDSAKFFVFGVGTGEVIEGFDAGLLGGDGVGPMRIGGVREVLIPPALAYGAKEVGGGRIPANSYLKFVVELVQIK